MILVTPRDDTTLAAVMEHLAEQTVAETIEVVIAAHDPSRVRVDPRHCARLWDVKVVAYDGPKIMSRARAAACRQATAPLIAMAEDHSYPHPHWAQTYIERHREGYAVIGPAMVNMNPATVQSWVSFLVAYGPWATPIEGGEADTVAGHNCAYDRRALLATGEDLPVYLGAETVLHWTLREQGRRLIVDPRAVCTHMNHSVSGVLPRFSYHGGRLFASVWARRLSWPRRWYLAAISPLICMRRLGGLMSAAKRHGAGSAGLFKLRIALIGSLLCGGAGFAVGFLLGPGHSAEFEWTHELDRPRYLCASDRRVLGVDDAQTVSAAAPTV